MCREMHKMSIQCVNVTLTQLEALLGQHHDTAAFRRFVGKRGELGGIGQFEFWQYQQLYKDDAGAT